MRVNGTLINYYFHCKRQCYLHGNRLNLEDNSEIVKITFPLLMPSVTILTFLNLTGGLKLFDLPYTLTAGAPNDATETVSMVIYRMAFKERKMGYASAVSVIFLLVIAVVSIVQVVATRKKEVEM